MPSIEKLCETCAKPMRIAAARLAEGKGRFCSMNCRKGSVKYLIRTCGWCSSTFTARQDRCNKGNGKYCSRSCTARATWANRPPGTAYRCVRIPDHPLADRTGMVGEHRVVLYEAIGPGEHPCHWCRQLIHWGPGYGKGSICSDHLDGNPRNNAPENLVPACARCNNTRNRKDLISDSEPHIQLAGNRGRHRAVERTCKTCGKQFLHLAADKRPNRGQYCSKPCMYQRVR